MDTENVTVASSIFLIFQQTLSVSTSNLLYRGRSLISYFTTCIRRMYATLRVFVSGICFPARSLFSYDRPKRD